MSSSTAPAVAAPWAPPALFFYVPGPLKPVRVNLDDWPDWHLSRSPWLDAAPSLRPPLGHSHGRRAVRPARAMRIPPRRIHLPRGAAVVWMGTPWVPWVVHPPSPPQPASGTPIGDLRLIASPSTSAEERLAALERTVSRLPWTPRRPATRRALRARVASGADGASTHDVKQHELRAAVYLVLAESDRAQRHRFGRSWAAGPDGRPSPLLPDQLPPDLYWRWFCDEVRKAAEASLVGDAYPPEAHRVDAIIADLDALPGSGAAGDPLELLLRAERESEAIACWQDALDHATPRQRALLRALISLDRDPAEGTPTLADAAALTGMAPSTARVQWKRLVDRLRQSPAHPPSSA